MKKASGKQAQGIPFHKLHGAGNDILVVESGDLPARGKAGFIKQMAHRHLGVGADQVLEVTSRRPLTTQVWNQDGTKAEMCANGTRVLLTLAARLKWIDAKAAQVSLRVSGKPYLARRRAEGYELSLGEPVNFGRKALKIEGQWLPFHEVNTGNPHAVILCGKGRENWICPKDFDFRYWGPRVETHPHFPRKTNVEFVREWSVRGNKAETLVEVWERGAGATLSCGSGAVAVATVLRDMYGVSDVKLRMNQFTLRVRFEGKEARLSGPVALVSVGRYFR